MSFKDFPDHLYELVTTGATTELGTYTINGYKQLSNVTLTMIFKDTASFTNERVRLVVERSSRPLELVGSEWFYPAMAIEDFTDANDWIGAVRFDFARENLQDQETGRIYIEADNYLFDQLGIQISAVLNYINESTKVVDVTDTTAAYLNIFGYQ